MCENVDGIQGTRILLILISAYLKTQISKLKTLANIPRVGKLQVKVGSRGGVGEGAPWEQREIAHSNLIIDISFHSKQQGIDWAGREGVGASTGHRGHIDIDIDINVEVEVNNVHIT